MSDISSQLIKDSYNYVLQSDLNTGVVYRIGGGIPINPIFQSGLTINSGFTYSNGSEQSGYVLTSDDFGNATWGPISGSSSGSFLPLSGGTVTGPTIFTGGLTANTISATTYFNLPSGLTCNDLSGCTIIQNIEQDIIDIQEDYVPYTGATKDLNLGYNTFINNNGLFTTWNNESSLGEAKFGYDYNGAKQMYFRDVDKTNILQYSGQTTEMLCNIEEGWGSSTFGFDSNDGTLFGSVISNTIGVAYLSTRMGSNNFSQVITTAGEVALTNLTNNAGPLMSSSIRLWKDYTKLSITNDDTTEDNTIEMYTDRTYTKKYITTDEGFVGDYANLNTLTSTTISATTYLNLPVSGVTGGTGISAGTTNGLVTIVNTLPDQTVTITGGTNISVNGTYPNFGINFTGSTGISGDFLPLSGGTVTGATNFTGGLTATTISATTYQNLPVTSLSGLSDVSITSVSEGDMLVYSGSSWVNRTLNEITGEYNVKITTPSSIVSGTTSETQVLKLEIPPYSFASNDVLNIPTLIISKVGTGGLYVLRVKLSELSTMPIGTGTQTIAFMSIGNTNIFTKLSRNFIINGGFLKGYPLSNNATDVANSTSSLKEQAFDHTITNYLYVSVAPAFAGDTFQLIGLQINNL